MGHRKPDPLPPPTREERNKAWIAAAALAGAILDGDPGTWPNRSWMHVNRGRKEHLWIHYWAHVPGFSHCNGQWTHDLLPGWAYTWKEVAAEMLPDLWALAEDGVRPTAVTSEHR